MKFSIIITFYKNTNMLENCINVLVQTLSEYSNVEILIINDNPNIDLPSQLHDVIQQTIPIRIIQLPENHGHSGACNIGVKESTGEYLIFLDSDIIVSNNWIIELETTFNAYSNCGAVAATILDFSNNQVVYFGMELYHSESIKPLQGALRQHPYLLCDRASQIVTSGCMLIKRTVFDEVGGFEEIFYNSCNDLDLSMKLNSAGYTNYISANSIVYHRGNISGPIRFASHIYARSFFFQKWKKEIENHESALHILRDLYAQQSVSGGDYLIIDFSSSIFSGDYLECFYHVNGVNPVDRYRIRCQSEKIIITDHLLWDVCQIKVPILYFVDDYRQIMGNSLWFRMRENEKDIIADRNGNIVCFPLETYS